MTQDTAPLKAFGFYLLRAPLLSYHVLQSLHAKEDADAGDAIRTIFGHPMLQEAIYLASPDLYEILNQWTSGTATLKPAKEQKLILSLYRYLLRMSTRCTPYGLFAGCSPGAIEHAPTDIRLDSGDRRQKVDPRQQVDQRQQAPRHRKIARIDMYYLSELIDQLEQDPAVNAGINYFPNSSIYLLGNAYRYYEYRLKDGKRSYFLSSFTRTPFLEQIIRAAEKGVPLQELVKVLTTEGIDAGDARAFLRTLVRNQVLISEWQPRISNPDHLGMVLRDMDLASVETPGTREIKDIHRHLNEPATGAGHYIDISRRLRRLFPGTAGYEIIQVDLFYNPRANTISSGVIETITSRLANLVALNQATPPPALRQFCDQFTRRYEGREVPLMTVLDSDNGVGYAVATGEKSSYTPLIDDLVIPADTDPEHTDWTALNSLAYEKFLAAAKQEAYAIELTDEDLQRVSTAGKEMTAGKNPPGHIPAMPATLCTMGTLLTESPAALDRGEFHFLLRSCAGPGALALMGRFAAGNKDLEEKMHQCAEYEKQVFGDRLIAEVIYLPEGRIGNVLLRPRFYDYEIPFLGNAGVDSAFRITVEDLLVSVIGRRVVLRSKRLGKEVIPRLTSAHNYSRGPAVYRFLCDLQFQYNPLNLEWNWQRLNGESFLPRVSYRQIIVKRARWLLRKQEFLALKAKGTEEDALDTLQAKYRLPAKLILAEGDNELFLQLSYGLGRKLLADKLSRADLILYESLETENNNLVAGSDGPHCNEIILPLYNPAFEPPPALVPAPPTRLRRTFPPGSEWLYVKIFCGAKQADKFLAGELAASLYDLKTERLIEEWFFIRYLDPANHIRLRLRTSSSTATTFIMERLNTLFSGHIETDVIHQLQYDSYIREIERYGEATMELSERLFFHDSEAVIGLLPYIQSDEREDYRWLLALRGVHDLLEEFGYTDEHKLQLIQQLQTSFFHEFNGNGGLLTQLNDKYRTHSRLIASALDTVTTEASSPLPLQALDILDVRKSRLRAIRRELGFHFEQEQLYPPQLRQLTIDYIHLFLNRLFVANHRLQEMVIYHYLTKHYASALAKARFQNTANE